MIITLDETKKNSVGQPIMHDLDGKPVEFKNWGKFFENWDGKGKDDDINLAADFEKRYGNLFK